MARFTRPLALGDTGADVEGVNRAYVRAGFLLARVPAPIRVFNALPQKARRRFNKSSVNAANKLKKAEGWKPTDRHDFENHLVLESSGAFDARAEALLKSWKPTPKVPALGPVWKGGKSVLEHDLTHATSGLPGYPAFDDAFVEGRAIIAPENMEVTAASTSRPGLAFFAKGDSGLRYWFGHLDRSHSRGRRFLKGEFVGYVGRNNIGGGPHVHVGIDASGLIGRELVHHTNYTHGAPTVGAQLRKALSG